MRILSEFSIKKPATSLMIIITMIFFGLLGLSKMPIELMPNISRPIVRINITWKGATPEDVDKLITRKVEDILPNIDGVLEYSSVSSAENSSILVKFKYGTDIDTKVTLLQNEVNQIKRKLPKDIKEPRVRKSSRRGSAAVVLAISGGDLIEVRSYAENSLKPLLERIEGVAEVRIIGGKEQEVLVEIDPEKLENYGLGILTISDLMAKSNVNIAGGHLNEGEKEFYVKVNGELQTPKEIADIVLKNENGHLLRVKDIADVRISTKDITDIFRKNDKDGLLVIVSKTDDGNSIEIVKQVDKVLKNIDGNLPLNAKIDYNFDSSITIINAINNVEMTAILGLFLASFILYIFLRSLTATVVISSAIPISVIFTFFLLNLQGISLNLTSLMGLSLGVGMLVDNSVVVLDNIYRHMIEYKKDRVQAAKDGAAEVGVPVLASTLTTIAVFIPIVFQEGIAKQQFQDLSYAVSYSLLASLIVSLLFVPMLSSRILNNKKEVIKDGKIIALLKKYYILLLIKAIRYRVIVVIGVVVLFIGSILSASTLGVGFIPKNDEGRFAVVAKLPTSANIDMSNRIGSILENRIKSVKEVKSYSFSGDTTSAILNIDAGLKSKRKKGMKEILNELRGVFTKIPDVVISVVPSFVFGTGGIYDFEFNLYSDNENQLREITDQMKRKMSKIYGLTDISSSFEGGKPEIKIHVDREKAKFYGVSIEDVAKMVKTQILGGQPITINSDNEEIDVTVQLQKKYRESVRELMNTRVVLNNGKSVRLSDIASITIEEGPSKIEKRDKKRKVTLYANLEKNLDLQTAKRKVIKEFQKLGISGVSYNFEGDGANMSKMSNQLLVDFAIGIFLIYFILVWQFESFVLPFIMLLSIPLSTMGALYSLAIFRVNFDMMVGIGFIMLAGIVVNNAIVLIDFINLRREYGDSINRALLFSGKTRLRPILMTTLTTVLGMIPLAVSNGEGSETYKGMAFAVIFGLSTAMLFTLVMIPIFYYIIYDIKLKIKKRV